MKKLFENIITKNTFDIKSIDNNCQSFILTILWVYMINKTKIYTIIEWWKFGKLLWLNKWRWIVGDLSFCDVKDKKNKNV